MSRSGLPRRMIGQIRREMGGTTLDSGSSGGGGGGSLTITNNVNGYILKATGDANRIEGISQLQYDSATNALTASADIVITGSGHPGANYLYLHGSDENGNVRTFKVEVTGAMFRVLGE